MAHYTVPDALADIVSVGEVVNGGFVAADLFQRKFRSAGPQHGRHIIVFYRDDDATLHVASYLHFWIQNRIGLIGGGCTDGNVMRRMQPMQREAINNAGGLLRQTLLYAFTEYRHEIDAFFGYCGDARAKEVDLAAGFCETEHEYLLVNWTSDTLSGQYQNELVAQAVALGPF